MTGKIVASGATLVLLVASGASAAQAQSAVPELKPVTVTAPQIVYRRVFDNRDYGYVEETSMSIAVDYGDLDLARVADVRELEGRVSKAATTICEELAEQIPNGRPSPSVCVKRATADALVQVEKAVQDAVRVANAVGVADL